MVNIDAIEQNPLAFVLRLGDALGLSEDAIEIIHNLAAEQAKATAAVGTQDYSDDVKRRMALLIDHVLKLACAAATQDLRNGQKTLWASETGGIAVDCVGSAPRADNQTPTAKYVICHSKNDGFSAVFMADQDRGCSITNAATQIVDYLCGADEHATAMHAGAKRWYYQDTDDFWTELIVTRHDGGGDVHVAFRGLGQPSTDDILNELSMQYGFEVSDEIRNKVADLVASSRESK